MNNPIRIMLCDDSAVMRRLLKSALQKDKTLKVVDEAENGQVAVDKLSSAKPDAVVMDVEMPVMDGIDAVREIRKRTKKMPIIMFSSLTSRGAEATLDAIHAGASDFATKPTSSGHISEAMAHVQKELIPKLHLWVERARRPLQSFASSSGAYVLPATQNNRTTPAKAAPPTAQASSGAAASGVAVVAIGVSTGGPQALAKVVSDLPVNLPVPILIVQHMPAVFTGLLASRLAAEKGHKVREAGNGEPLEPGQIIVAPGEQHLVVAREGNNVFTRLTQDPPVNSCRPAVDPLFKSLAQCYGDQCLGVIMTGMGRDGEQGARELRNRGGKIYVQDEASSVVWGMPGNIVQCGLADRVVPLDQMAGEILQATKKPVALKA